MFKIVGQRITSCACALLKIKSTKIISSIISTIKNKINQNNKFINLPTHRIILMMTNEQDLNGSLMQPNR